MALYSSTLFIKGKPYNSSGLVLDKLGMHQYFITSGKQRIGKPNTNYFEAIRNDGFSVGFVDNLTLICSYRLFDIFCGRLHWLTKRFYDFFPNTEMLFLFSEDTGMTHSIVLVINGEIVRRKIVHNGKFIGTPVDYADFGALLPEEKNHYMSVNGIEYTSRTENIKQSNDYIWGGADYNVGIDYLKNHFKVNELFEEQVVFNEDIEAYFGNNQLEVINSPVRPESEFKGQVDKTIYPMLKKLKFKRYKYKSSLNQTNLFLKETNNLRLEVYPSIQYLNSLVRLQLSFEVRALDIENTFESFLTDTQTPNVEVAHFGFSIIEFSSQKIYTDEDIDLQLIKLKEFIEYELTPLILELTDIYKLDSQLNSSVSVKSNVDAFNDWISGRIKISELGFAKRLCKLLLLALLCENKSYQLIKYAYDRIFTDLRELIAEKDYRNQSTEYYIQMMTALNKATKTLTNTKHQ